MLPPNISQSRIVLVAGIILVAVTLLVGVTVFKVMQQQAEELLNKSLQSSLQSRVQLTEIEISTAFGKTTVVSTRPLLIDQVQRVNTGVDDGTARAILNKVAQSFLPTGLTAISVFDKEGRELATAGTFAQKPALTVALKLPGSVQLMWDGQLLLHAVADMTLAGKVVGKVMTETSLPATMGAIKDANRLGDTGEMGLCAPLGVNMQCFPTTLNPNMMTIPRVAANGDLLPMAYALAGKTGFVKAKDYRSREVEAAYAPVGDFGLGMVLKIDGADLYTPIWQQLRILTPLLLAVLIIALLSLRWLISPLVLRLMNSQAEAHAMNQSLIDSEKQLRLQSRSLSEVIWGADIGTWNWNIKTGETVFNERWAGMLGYTLDELAPITIDTWIKLVHPDDAIHANELLAKCFTGESEIYTLEARMRHKNGEWAWVSTRGRVIEWAADGEPLVMSGTHVEITERKQAQEEILGLNTSLEQRVQRRTAQLHASNRDLQEFAYSVAHDLRQPFIAIGGFSSMLERMVTDEPAKYYAARINAGVRQAGELTDALLALANLSRVQLSVQAVDISAMARSVMDTLQYQDPARLTRLIIEDDLIVRADPLLIKQVMQGLLENAWKFTSRKSCTEISFGMLLVEAGNLRAEPVYVVRDNGEGFDMTYAAKLFQSFQRLHSAQDFPGTGAGLANIRRIVARHNGEVWAESAVGKGASFFFTLGKRPSAMPTIADPS